MLPRHGPVEQPGRGEQPERLAVDRAGLAHLTIAGAERAAAQRLGVLLQPALLVRDQRTDELHQPRELDRS